MQISALQKENQNMFKLSRKKPFPAPYLGTSILGDEELSLLTEVIKTKLPFREYGDGTPHMVLDFEKEARRYLGVKYALATATGSGSFFCAMAGLGIGPGDEVIIPSFGWYTDFVAPVLAGAVPVFADIDRSLNMDLDDLARKITPNTKAVIIVHFQGACIDMDRLLSIAQKHQIKVIEDCAQSCGGTYKGRKLGSIGDVGCFSFQQNKVISTGDGGLLTTSDSKIFERAARFHDLGILRPSMAAQLENGPSEPHIVGCQFRMNEFTGAVALAQLRKLDSRILNVTRSYFSILKKRLQQNCPEIRFRPTGDDNGDCGILLCIDMGSRTKAEHLKLVLMDYGIPVQAPSACRNLITSDLVQGRQQANANMPPFGKGFAGEFIQYKPEMAPNTDEIVASMVVVPLTPAYDKQDVDDIGTAIIQVWNS